MTNSDAARSFHALGERPDGDDEAVRARRAAIADLGEALRDLVHASVATESPTEDLLRAAAQIRAATGPIARHQRERQQVPSADDLLGGIRMYNPVSGTGNPLAPPLRMGLLDGGGVIGTCTLGLVYEGPPMYAHGGISALLLDQMLGYATSASGRPGLTVGLVMGYRAPVPLLTPLRMTAKVTATDGRKVTAHGIITTAAEPDVTLVDATGTFIALRPDQADRLFRAALHPDATDPAAAHD